MITAAEAMAVASEVYRLRSEKVRFVPGARNRILFAARRRFHDQAALYKWANDTFRNEEMMRWDFPHLYEDWRPWAK